MKHPILLLCTVLFVEVLPTFASRSAPRSGLNIDRSANNGRRNSFPDAAGTSDNETGTSLLPNYDRTFPLRRPDGAPINVTVNLFIRELQINPVKMELNTVVTLRVNWTDSRLIHAGPAITLNDAQQIWIPDIFFQDEKTAHFHNVMTPNNLIRISPKGEVAMSSRISLTLACQMNFKWFPMDSQSCKIRLASYAHTTNEINLQWKNETPVQLPNPGLHFLTTDKYRLEEMQTDQSVASTLTGNYTGLAVTLVFKRVLTSYMWHYFLPTIVLVALSWIVFWFHPNLITPRIFVGFLTLLATLYFQVETTQSSAISTTSCDIWGAICALFIALSLLETVVAHHLNCRERFRENFLKLTSATSPNDGACDILSEVSLMEQSNGTGNSCHFFKMTSGNRVDAISRFLFPMLFLLLSIIFWAVCLS